MKDIIEELLSILEETQKIESKRLDGPKVVTKALKTIVENYNRQARRYVRKGSDISQYSDQYWQMVETKLNSRYMAVIGYQTPTEAIVAYRKDQKVSRFGTAKQNC